jgi:hypothetical protein
MFLVFMIVDTIFRPIPFPQPGAHAVSRFEETMDAVVILLAIIVSVVYLAKLALTLGA